MARRSNHNTRTDAERDARRKADRERIEQAARALLTSEGWRRWIKVRASNGLSRYSLRNQWLIAIDCHARGITPTYVAGFRAFLDLNRCVRKGEQAIRLMRSTATPAGSPRPTSPASARSSISTAACARASRRSASSPRGRYCV